MSQYAEVREYLSECRQISCQVITEFVRATVQTKADHPRQQCQVPRFKFNSLLHEGTKLIERQIEVLVSSFTKSSETVHTSNLLNDIKVYKSVESFGCAFRLCFVLS